jgi:hypothetical protein
MLKLILIRGLPGSGKTTMAKSMMTPSTRHYEADMYFEKPGGSYLFDPKKIKQAHEWCQRKTRAALEAGLDVIVSNTFTQHWEMESYVKMAEELGAKLEIITARGQWQNIHGVPDSAIQRMKNRWQD